MGVIDQLIPGGHHRSTGKIRGTLFNLAIEISLFPVHPDVLGGFLGQSKAFGHGESPGGQGRTPPGKTVRVLKAKGLET